MCSKHCSCHISDHISDHISGHTSGEECHAHEAHCHGSSPVWLKTFAAPAVSFLMLVSGMVMSHLGVSFFTTFPGVQLAWYILAFLPVGLPVMREAWEEICRKDVFNEFTLMSIACIGAFCIREFPEAVGVMLFYSIGESLQDMAVDKARDHISRLVDRSAKVAHLVRGGTVVDVAPDSVAPGDTIRVFPGERVPLDGVLLSREAVFDTSALTGESVPREVESGGDVLAGMISSGATVTMRVTKKYSESTLSRILALIEQASGRKAGKELFIRRFSRIYTPVVIVLAALLVAVPWIVGMANPSFHFVFSEWFYRALVFLVISCPCALVISVPLAYFAGIGAASRAGILFKGGNYLEELAKVNIVAFDKTGTLTTGHFGVSDVCPARESGNVGLDADGLLSLMASAESGSTHPLAKALVDYARRRNVDILPCDRMEEFPGFGVEAVVGDHRVLAGSPRLLVRKGILAGELPETHSGTVIVCAIDGKFAGHAVLADTIKDEASAAVDRLRDLGVDRIVMLSGDRMEVTRDYARRLSISEAYGDLLPQDKAAYVEAEASRPGRSIAFVGDGMNDAPVIAISNVGIAMGGAGSDAAVENADVVIQADSPLKVAEAISIGRKTHAVVIENIVGAIGIKVAVMVLGAFGIASLWAAVFADVGVALLAVLNSVRILRRR